MRTGEVFDSKWLKASDLGKARPVVTIDRVEIVKMRDGKRKPVLWFKGKEKGLVCNVTNANRLIGMTGTDEMDDWRGQRVTLFATKVEFGGQTVDAIRLEDPPQGQPAKEKLPPPEPLPDEDDDVPF